MMLKRLWVSLRLLIIFACLALVFDQDAESGYGVNERVLAATRGQTFNYVAWEAEALWSKAKQEFLGFQPYLEEDQRKQLVLDYFDLQRRVWNLEGQIEAATLNESDNLPNLQQEYDQARQDLQDQQALAEHILEGQISSVLRDEGFSTFGQVLPPVTMHFLDIPDVLVISPRDEIRQYMTLTLQPMNFTERVTLEDQVAAAVPDMSAWITPIGGVGIYPSMVKETDRAVVAFEITAHEWTHHYLFFFPLGLEYLSHPDTRIINETTATLVGDEIGNKIIQQFYQAELVAGRVYLQPTPNYRTLLAAVEGSQTANLSLDRQSLFESNTQSHQAYTRQLADYLVSVGNSEAAQLTIDRRTQQAKSLGFYPSADPTLQRADIDQGGWIHHTRVNADYLLKLGNIPAAELVMDNGEQHTGYRVLNQAWFAFNAGYQSNPVIEQRADGTSTIVTAGGGGDPIGAAIYEIRARSATLKDFLEIMRSVTTREELFAALERVREF